MAIKNRKVFSRKRIKQRVRKKVFGTPERPRLSVFKSNKQIYAQIINDIDGHTLVAASSREGNVTSSDNSKTNVAKKVGQKVAEKATESGINHVVFDRNGYLYHGRVKSLAEAAREGGLKF